jgi:hypothetical protein
MSNVRPHRASDRKVSLRARWLPYPYLLLTATSVPNMNCNRSLLGFALILTALNAVAKCPVGASTEVGEFAVFMCVQKSELALRQRSGTDTCVPTLKSEASDSFDRLKACLKKTKNLEALRALAEWTTAWEEAYDVMESPRGDPDELEQQMKVVQKKQRIAKALI